MPGIGFLRRGLLRAPTSHQDVEHKFRGICLFSNSVTRGKSKTGLVSAIDNISLQGLQGQLPLYSFAASIQMGIIKKMMILPDLIKQSILST